MKRQHLSWLLVAALLAGCAVSVPTRQPVETKEFRITVAVPQVLPSAVRTLVPAATGYPVLADTPYPAPLDTQAAPATAYPYPAPQVPGGSPTPAAGAAAGALAAPFQDCARTPGLVGCDPAAVPLKVRLAYIDPSPGRLVGLDLETGQGWQVAWKGRKPGWMEWSVGGAQEARLLASLDGGWYQVFSSDGSLLETFFSETVPTWQPDGVLSRDGSVHSPAGDTARLEHTRDLIWLLHVKTAQGEKVLPLDTLPGDILYKLLGWAPGGQALLAQSYYAGNEAMTQGGRVVAIDATTGAVRAIRAFMPLSDFPSRYFAWDPASTGRLAFLESGDTGVLAPRLALLDFQTGAFQYSLAGDLPISSPSWSSDGKLVFTVASSGLNQPAAQKGVGIYLLDSQTGKGDSLVEPPPGGTVAWPHWTADGQALVYARVLPGQKDQIVVQVRAIRISDGAEWVLVEGLQGAGTMDRPGFLEGLIAYSLQ